MLKITKLLLYLFETSSKYLLGNFLGRAQLNFSVLYFNKMELYFDVITVFNHSLQFCFNDFVFIASTNLT